MICDLCGEREAEIFLEKTNNNTKQKISICSSCAAARGFSTHMSKTNPQNVESLFIEVEERKMRSHPDSHKLCPSCGRNLYDIKKSGVAGCPECYEAFKEEIFKAMAQHGIQGTYTGTMPLRVARFRNALTDRVDIRAKLEAAVRAENYEKAAVYRDYLRALEKGCVADGTNGNENGENQCRI